jgi:hypothetical protein
LLLLTLVFHCFFICPELYLLSAFAVGPKSKPLVHAHCLKAQFSISGMFITSCLSVEYVQRVLHPLDVWQNLKSLRSRASGASFRSRA